MQYYIKILLQGLPMMALCFFVIATILLIVSRIKIAREKQLNKEFSECIACKDAALEEFKKIRHDYNNMLQTITCFIEEEDFDGLNEYKSIMLQKTHSLNGNDLTQLVKIKDKSVLRTVYKLFVRAKETGITLNLTIYNDVAEISAYKAELYSLLQHSLNHAYELAVNDALIINLKINSNDMGLSFCFESSFNNTSAVLTSKKTKAERHNKPNKKIIFNTFIQKDKLIQEILIPFNL